MVKIFKTSLKALAMLACVGGLVSCLEDPAELNAHTDQLFRPISFTAGINGASVDFSWVPIKNASYSLEVSRDSLKFTNELQVIKLDSTTGYIVSGLWSSSRYSARIKAVSKDPLVKDSEYQLITFITGVENIFFAVDPAGISSSSVALAWGQTPKVTRIRVMSGTTEVLIKTLSPAEIAEAKATITGLKPVTKYDFQIYNGDMLRGTSTVTTTKSP